MLLVSHVAIPAFRLRLPPPLIVVAHALVLAAFLLVLGMAIVVCGGVCLRTVSRTLVHGLLVALLVALLFVLVLVLVLCSRAGKGMRLRGRRGMCVGGRRQVV